MALTMMQIKQRGVLEPGTYVTLKDRQTKKAIAFTVEGGTPEQVRAKLFAAINNDPSLSVGDEPGKGAAKQRKASA